MRILWTRPALRALDAIERHVAEDNPSASSELIVRIFEHVTRLVDHPHLGRPGRIAGTRELVVPGTPYLVPYRVRDGHVEILSVFHGARRWPLRLE